MIENWGTVETQYVKFKKGTHEHRLLERIQQCIK